MKYNGLLFLSGGLDSMTLAYSLVKDNQKIRALHFVTGRYASDQELHATKKISLELGFPLEIVDMTGIQQMMRGLMPPEVAMTGEWDSVCPTETTAFPILLSTGLYYAQMTGISELHIGVLAEQIAQRPRVPDFYRLTSEASGYIDPRYASVKICTPFLDKSKGQVILVGHELKVPLEESWSCWRGGSRHCGVCPGCKSRVQAFADAGVPDKTEYKDSAAQE